MVLLHLLATTSLGVTTSHEGGLVPESVGQTSVGHRLAYVTYLSDPAYVPGIEALLQSLHEAQATAPLVVLRDARVSDSSLASLRRCGNSSSVDMRAVEVPSLSNPYVANKEYESTLGKLFLFSDVTGVDRAVFLDADTIVVRNIDSLFDLAQRHSVAAAPDNGISLNPDRFNSGVLVVAPSNETFARLLSQVGVARSYDGGDQGLLNTFFDGSWQRLEQRFNTLQRRAPYGDYDWPSVRVLHMVGQDKPWLAAPQDINEQPLRVWREMHQRWQQRCEVSR
jgi:glycogenin glucosyltransferase